MLWPHTIGALQQADAVQGAPKNLGRAAVAPVANRLRQQIERLAKGGYRVLRCERYADRLLEHRFVDSGMLASEVQVGCGNRLYGGPPPLVAQRRTALLVQIDETLKCDRQHNLRLTAGKVAVEHRLGVPMASAT